MLESTMEKKQPQLRVNLSSEQRNLLPLLAKKKRMSVSALAQDLINTALELEEDAYYSEISENRLAQAKKLYSHADVMQQFAND